MEAQAVRDVECGDDDAGHRDSGGDGVKVARSHSGADWHFFHQTEWSWKEVSPRQACGDDGGG